MSALSFESSRISLRPLLYEDADAIFAYCSNDNVSQLTGWRTHQCIEDSERYIERALDISNSRDLLANVWALVLTSGSDGKAIGTIELSRESDTSVRIDYALSEQQWNKGLMSEAAGLVIDWVFENNPSIVQIRSGALSDNVASLKVMEKCGLVFQTRHLMAIDKFDGEVRELSEYSLHREVWQMMEG